MKTFFAYVGIPNVKINTAALYWNKPLVPKPLLLTYCELCSSARSLGINFVKYISLVLEHFFCWSMLFTLTSHICIHCVTIHPLFSLKCYFQVGPVSYINLSLSSGQRMATWAYSPGGRFNNAYELLTLRALKISMFHKRFIFQCMGKIFCVEFQRYPLKFHTKYLTHTLKDMTFIQHWNFKSS